jgi:O-antigen/teichoic acid export membrane protein
LHQIRLDADDTSIWHRVRRNVSMSLLGSGLTLGLKLGQTTLLARTLTIDDYGRVFTVLNVFVFFDSFFGLRVSDVMFRFFQPLHERHDMPAVKGLLLVCLGISLASGLAIYGGVLAASPWLAERLYPHLGLAPLFTIYGCTVLVSACSGVYEPLLRIHDRFASIVVPQVLGSLVTLMLLSAYVATHAGYTLTAVITIFTIGAFVQTVPPLVRALHLARPFLQHVGMRVSVAALAKQRSDLLATLWHSNLSGYLKLATAPGDLFVLGLFSSPTQVALYGLGKQFTAPLGLLQTNIQTAITPEINALIAQGRLAQLKRLVGRYFALSIIVSGVFLVGGLLLGHLLIVRLFPPAYIAALPVFYVLVVAAWLLLGFLVFRPLAVGLDALRWHNLAMLVSTAGIVLLASRGMLSAWTMACIQLVEASLLRMSVGALVWMRLRSRAMEGAHR